MQNRLPDFPLSQYRSLQQCFRYEIHDTTFVLLLQLPAEFLPMEKNRTSPSCTATLGCSSMASTILLAEKLDKKARTVQETSRKTLAVSVNRSLSEFFSWQQVTLPNFCLNRVFSQCCFQLFAHCRKMNPNRIAHWISIPIPNMVNQFLLGDQLSWMHHKIFQYRQFFCCKVDFSTPTLAVRLSVSIAKSPKRRTLLC